MTQNVLVTGGPGFIGSHVVRALLMQREFADYRITVLDNLSGDFGRMCQIIVVLTSLKVLLQMKSS